METDLLSNVRGNVKALRNMWSTKSEDQEKPSRPHSEQQQLRKSMKDTVPIVKVTNATATTIPIIKKESPVTPKAPTFQPVEKLSSIEENISSPPSVSFKHLAKPIAQTASNAISNIRYKDPKNSGIHHWHVTRNVFRSGLIFNQSRRASDSILPLLIKTHAVNRYSHSDSVDSTNNQTPFENRIDYVTYDKDSLAVPKKTKRSASYTSDCIRRNKLDDSISQYEMILRHLKNYEQFKTTYPVPAISTIQHGKTIDNESINLTDEIQEKFRAKTSIPPNRQTQSLSRNVGRTFSDFLMNDLLLSASSRTTSSEQPRSSISDASSQTDLSEPVPDIKYPTFESLNIVHSIELNRNNSIPNEEAKAILNELDTMLEDSNQESPITPNTEINVIVLNSPRTETTLPTVKPLMQRLFEGKKTAYSPADLTMRSIRLPEEMLPEYETAKKKCFFDSEELVYITKMIKITRRGYKQHVRMLAITTERVYHITKKDPYPKEGLLFKDLLGVSCTPYKDGLVCIHTREKYEDRGDWLAILDHPCEFVTKLFMILGRDNNDDNFLKIVPKFVHYRRFYTEGITTECTIEARLADTFRIKKIDIDLLAIYTP